MQLLGTLEHEVGHTLGPGKQTSDNRLVSYIGRRLRPPLRCSSEVGARYRRYPQQSTRTRCAPTHAAQAGQAGACTGG
eukprot:11409522-Alexandrium_andersonii.AAC.1